ncbi:DinB family protein [Kitasatospora sp. NBC_01246]|uniref:mycothiol transferase n=1 Tax=Kitasatospora sp. NBC_01246 TaxID=2903570 RepID=UPI002E371AA4|nr:DinB family protein [Kitasatospora sp. NBC_01246]
MKSADLLADAFGRIHEAVHDVVDGLTAEELAERVDPKANSIVWLVWHLTRIQDDHIADAAGTEQIWTADGWFDRFALGFPAAATGYGHRARDVAAVRVDSPELLTGYHDAVHERTLSFVRGLTGPALDRVVDEAWSPPVTLGVRLVSVISDDLQHIGQAAFVRGVLRRG